MLYLHPKKLDIQTDESELQVYLNTQTARRIGIEAGSIIVLYYKDIETGATVILSDTLVSDGEIGLSFNIWEEYKISSSSYIAIEPIIPTDAMNAIRKKIKGQPLTEEEIFILMKNITERKLSDIELTYFVSTFFNPGFSKKELVYLTKAMAQTGTILKTHKLSPTVLDKHSIGGVPSKGVTPIITSILASMGFLVPNTSSRSITTPAGTSDMLEVIMPVTLDNQRFMSVLEKCGATLAWGGGLDLAPADDILIQIEKPLGIENIDNFVVSILAKKVATGITHQLIDIPYGKEYNAKVTSEQVPYVRKLFKDIGHKLGINVITYERKVLGPDGNGIGPLLEIRDVLYILERNPRRPLALENLAIDMTSRLIAFVTQKNLKDIIIKVREQLESQEALKKFWEIAYAQGATVLVKSDDLTPAKYNYTLTFAKAGVIKEFNNWSIKKLMRVLGTPFIKTAGGFMHASVGDTVKKGQPFITLYAESLESLEKAKKLAEQMHSDFYYLN